MAFISVTRLRLRSYFYLPQFIWHAYKSSRQAERADGFLDGRTVREASNTFWTVTAWQDEASMRQYRGSEAHSKAMPKLLDWCDEASVVNWQQDSSTLPDWEEAYAKMVAKGRTSKVRHPSKDQLDGNIEKARLISDEGQKLKPAK